MLDSSFYLVRFSLPSPSLIIVTTTLIRLSHFSLPAVLCLPALSNPMEQLYPRHGNHTSLDHSQLPHYANLPYTWITLAALAGYVAVFFAVHTAYIGTRIPKLYYTASVVMLLAMVVALISFLSGIGSYYQQRGLSIFLKRLARVGYALVPLLALLLFRPPKFGYLSRIRLHKWAGWIVTALTTVHGVGFMFKWYVQDTLGAKLAKLTNVAGLVIMLLQWGFIAVLFTGIRYSWWYWVHNAMAMVYVFVTIYHADPGVVLLGILGVAFCGVQVATHFFSTAVLEVLVLAHPNSSLVVARIPSVHQVVPGGHIRLSSHWYLPLHPYTVAGSGEYLELVVSRRRYDITHSSKLMGPYLLEVPAYPPTTALTICCGGLGISMAMGLIQAYPSLNIIWCIKAIDDLHVLSHLSHKIDPSHLQVYLTRGSRAAANEPEAEPETEGLMMHDLSHSPVDKSSINTGRPLWNQLITADSLVVVVACGPPLLVSQVRHHLQSEGIPFVAEPYAM